MPYDISLIAFVTPARWIAYRLTRDAFPRTINPQVADAALRGGFEEQVLSAKVHASDAGRLPLTGSQAACDIHALDYDLTGCEGHEACYECWYSTKPCYEVDDADKQDFCDSFSNCAAEKCGACTDLFLAVENCFLSQVCPGFQCPWV